MFFSHFLFFRAIMCTKYSGKQILFTLLTAKTVPKQEWEPFSLTQNFMKQEDFSMVHTMENEYLRVGISDAGAELVSIYDKKNKREVIWQADPAYWKRHAPVLFPNVGRHYGDHYRVHGQEYPSRQHGFARDTEFLCTAASDTSVTHEMTSSDATRASYPFDFVLRITHSLTDREVQISWEVINKSAQSMYFTIGGHPAFRVPVLEGTDYSDYSLTFEGQDSLTYLLLDPASGTAFAEKTCELKLTDGNCRLDTHMFDHDALVFDHSQISRAGILLPDGSPYLELRCEGFPNFGIWSVPGAPFVCLEPWMGRCDNCGYHGPLDEKPDINSLEPNETFQKSYVIKIF